MTTANDAAQKHRCAGSGLHCVIHACVAPSRDRRRLRRTRARRRCSSHSRAEAPPARVLRHAYLYRSFRSGSASRGPYAMSRVSRANGYCGGTVPNIRVETAPARAARRLVSLGGDGWAMLCTLMPHSVSLDAPCRHSQTASESCGGQCRRISAPLAVPRVEGPLGRRRAVFRHGVPPCGRGARKGRRNSIESVR
jgi:hypothetical protein